MKAFNTTFIILISTFVYGCASQPPVPTMVDTTVPSAVDVEGLRATLRVLSRGETNRLFGSDTGAYFGVVELKVENRGAMPVSVERKWIRIVTPEGKEVYPASPLGVANLTRGQAMTATGNNVFDAIQLVFGLARLAQNYEVAAKWDPLMPETLKVAAGEERRILLAFSTPNWVPGLWRLELPFNSDTEVPGLQLSIPLTFKAVASPPR
jgi:hypothetical protein